MSTRKGRRGQKNVVVGMSNNWIMLSILYYALIIICIHNVERTSGFMVEGPSKSKTSSKTREPKINKDNNNNKKKKNEGFFATVIPQTDSTTTTKTTKTKETKTRQGARDCSKKEEVELSTQISRSIHTGTPTTTTTSNNQKQKRKKKRTKSSSSKLATNLAKSLLQPPVNQNQNNDQLDTVTRTEPRGSMILGSEILSPSTTTRRKTVIDNEIQQSLYTSHPILTYPPPGTRLLAWSKPRSSATTDFILSGNPQQQQQQTNSNGEDVMEVRLATWQDDEDIAKLRLSVFAGWNLKPQQLMQQQSNNKNRGSLILSPSPQVQPEPSKEEQEYYRQQSLDLQQQFVQRSKQIMSQRRPLGATNLIVVQKEDNRRVLGNVECSIHEFDSTLLGQCRLPHSLLYLTEVAVNKSFQRRGIGSKLLQAVEELVRRRNEEILIQNHNDELSCRHVEKRSTDNNTNNKKRFPIETLYLHVDVTNMAALGLYAKAGYRRVDPSNAMYHQFTKSLNLHDGATMGRNHYLLYKNIRQPTWCHQQQSTTTEAAGTATESLLLLSNRQQQQQQQHYSDDNDYYSDDATVISNQGKHLNKMARIQQAQLAARQSVQSPPLRA